MNLNNLGGSPAQNNNNPFGGSNQTSGFGGVSSFNDPFASSNTGMGSGNF